MDHNEKAWKKRCLGKAHRENVYSISLTPEQAKLIYFNRDDVIGFLFLNTEKQMLNADPGIAATTLDLLAKLAKNTTNFMLVAVGKKDVDDGLMTVEKVHSLIDSAELDGNEKVTLSFIPAAGATFAYPQYVTQYDLVKVLRFMIEEGIIEASTTTTSLDEDGNCEQCSLLYNTLLSYGFDCFCYLLSVPGTDVNAVAWSVLYADAEAEDRGRDYCSIIHSCIRNVTETPLCYLEELLRCKKLDLSARNSFGRDALYLACNKVFEGDDDAATKIRMLLKAGADPRARYGNMSFLSILDERIEEVCTPFFPTKKLLQLRAEIEEKISEFNERD